MFVEPNGGVNHNGERAPEVTSSASFGDFKADVMEELEEISYPVRYPGKATLFAEGEAPRGIFILYSGRVKLFLCSGEGRMLIVRMAGPGDVIGLPGTLSGWPYEVTAETLLPCELAFVKRKPFLRFMHSHKEVCIGVADQLTKIYSSLCHEVRCLGLSQSADEKLAKLLLDWPLNQGDTPSQIKFPFTHEELAQMIGSARETVSRVFGELKRRHIAEQEGATLHIYDRAGLEELAAELLPPHVRSSFPESSSFPAQKPAGNRNSGRPK
jgi:CRP/FNR family cyclic AMP-dependent transcriptional regulator